MGDGWQALGDNVFAVIERTWQKADGERERRTSSHIKDLQANGLANSPVRSGSPPLGGGEGEPERRTREQSNEPEAKPRGGDPEAFNLPILSGAAS
jgi:hypothetical protein